MYHSFSSQHTVNRPISVFHCKHSYRCVRVSETVLPNPLHNHTCNHTHTHTHTHMYICIHMPVRMTSYQVIRQNCSHSRLLRICSATLKTKRVRGLFHREFQTSFQNCYTSFYCHQTHTHIPSALYPCPVLDTDRHLPTW